MTRRGAEAAKGIVECGDVILLAEEVSLRSGGFVVAIEGWGPFGGYRGPWRLYAPDGSLVTGGELIDIPSMTMACQFRIELAAVVVQPG
jgi:hypothetical protein